MAKLWKWIDLFMHDHQHHAWLEHLLLYFAIVSFVFIIVFITILIFKKIKKERLKKIEHQITEKKSEKEIIKFLSKKKNKQQ